MLDSHGLCNLTTVNVMAFVADGKLDVPALLETQKLSARAGYRMTCRELEMHSWDVVQKRDRLIGCSLTGWQDMVNATNMSREAQIELQEKLRDAAHTASADLAAHLGTKPRCWPPPSKPEGHAVAAAHGVQRRGTIRIRRTMCAACASRRPTRCARCARIWAIPCCPRSGRDPDDPTTKVVEFPVKAPAGRVKSDVSAIEQLENYKMFMQHYVDHNCSITVHVRNDEWGRRRTVGVGQLVRHPWPSRSSATTTASMS